jgi:hypothetical protein
VFLLVDRVVLDTAGLGVLILAAELAVARVIERGVRSSTDGLLTGVFVLAVELGVLVLSELGVLGFLFDGGVFIPGVACAGVLVPTEVAGGSATALATVAGEAAATLSALGDLAEPLDAWQSVQCFRARGFEHPHAAHDQIPVFSVSPLPYERDLLFLRRSSRAVGFFSLLSPGVPTWKPPLLVVGVLLAPVVASGDFRLFSTGAGDAWLAWLSGITMTSLRFASTSPSCSFSDSLSATIPLTCDAVTSSSSCCVGGPFSVRLRLADELTLLDRMGCWGVLSCAGSCAGSEVPSIFRMASDVMGSMDSARRFLLLPLSALLILKLDAGGGVHGATLPTLGGASVFLSPCFSASKALLASAPRDWRLLSLGLGFTAVSTVCWLTGKNGRSSIRFLLT